MLMMWVVGTGTWWRTGWRFGICSTNDGELARCKGDVAAVLVEHLDVGLLGRQHQPRRPCAAKAERSVARWRQLGVLVLLHLEPVHRPGLPRRRGKRQLPPHSVQPIVRL